MLKIAEEVRQDIEFRLDAIPGMLHHVASQNQMHQAEEPKKQV